MRKPGLLVIVAFAAIAMTPNAAHASAERSRLSMSKKNADGTLLSIERRRDSVLLRYQARSATKGSKSREQFIKLSPDFADAPFFAADFIDVDADGQWEIELTGLCGNKVCEKVIYKMHPAEHLFSKFFEGSYSRVTMLNGYLVESGASGCCTYEHHAYRIMPEGFGISGPPTLVIVVSSPEESASLPARCSFSDGEGKKTAPPDAGWLKLCEVYGSGYQVTQ